MNEIAVCITSNLAHFHKFLIRIRGPTTYAPSSILWFISCSNGHRERIFTFSAVGPWLWNSFPRVAPFLFSFIRQVLFWWTSIGSPLWFVYLVALLLQYTLPRTLWHADLRLKGFYAVCFIILLGFDIEFWVLSFFKLSWGRAVPWKVGYKCFKYINKSDWAFEINYS